MIGHVRQGVRLFAMAVFATALSVGLARADYEIGTSKTGLLIWLADAIGALQREAPMMRVSEIGSGVVAVNRVSDQTLTFGTSSEFAFTSKILTDPSLCIYATISSSRTTRLISRSDMVGPEASDLIGQSVAVTENSIGQYFLSQFLLLSGIEDGAVEIVPGKPGEIVDMVLNGSVAAGITWEPHVTNILTGLGGIGGLAQTYPDQEDQYFYFVLHGQCDLDEGRATALRGLLKALIEAENFAHEDPEEAQRLLAERLSLTEEKIQAIWPQHSLRIVLPQDLLTAIESEADWRISRGISEGPTPNSLDFVDTVPLRAVAPDAVRVIE